MSRPTILMVVTPTRRWQAQSAKSAKAEVSYVEETTTKTLNYSQLK